MKIALSTGGFALIDRADLSLIAGRTWRAAKLGRGSHTLYAVVGSWNPKTKGVRLILMHRLILKARPGQNVDHVNGNGLDNRRRNLRFATHTQNMMNRRSYSGYKGVSFESRIGRWRARITVNGITQSLGYFTTEHGAARAYNKAAREVWGARAHLNVIR
jgi:hypothetical protein